MDANELFLMYQTMDFLFESPAVERKSYIRVNPLEEMSTGQFRNHYRMSKDTFSVLHDMLKTELFTSNSGNSRQVSTEIQLLAVLRYYATGCIQVSVGDLHGLSQPYVSRLIRHVSRLLAVKSRDHIKFTTDELTLNERKIGFRKIANFPGVIGAIDCTHIKVRIPSTAGDKKEWYTYNSSGYNPCPKHYHTAYATTV